MPSSLVGSGLGLFGASLVTAGWFDDVAQTAAWFHPDMLDDAWEFTEAVRPNGVTLTNLTGAYTDIDDDPGNPDASWLAEA